jgi:hypothetical protein
MRFLIKTLFYKRILGFNFVFLFVQKDIENLIKILISVLLIGEIQFSHKKGNNYDAVQVKNMEIIENGIKY